MFAGLHETFDSMERLNYDIDTPVDVIQANVRRLQGRPRQPQMGYDKCSKLTSGEKSARNNLSDRLKGIVLGVGETPNNMSPSPGRPQTQRLLPAPPRKFNTHSVHDNDIRSIVDVRIHNLFSQNGNTGEQTHGSQQEQECNNHLLACAASRQNMPAGTNLHQVEPRKLMSSSTGSSSTKKYFTID